MAIDTLTGSLWINFLYDVAEEIQLDRLRGILAIEAPGREPSFQRRAPEYVRFQQPPVVQSVPPTVLAGVSLGTRIHYYEYGVISIAMELPLQCRWDELAGLAHRWNTSPELERAAESLVNQQLLAAEPALVDRYPKRLAEDYCSVHVLHQDTESGGRLSAAEIVRQHGQVIAQIVRGERVPLSDEEVSEALNSRLSYYPDDLLVVGWSGAVLYDSPEGAVPIQQLLEYANSQLLNFRHYDELLTNLLADVYKSLQHGKGFFRRWQLWREAASLNAVRLDVEDLTERMDNSIKFLSDMYWARVYRLAAAKVGVPDYRTLVDEKLTIAGDLYRSMMDQFHEGRGFVLELTVVIILIIDLIFLFREL